MTHRYQLRRHVLTILCGAYALLNLFGIGQANLGAAFGWAAAAAGWYAYDHHST